MNIEQHGYEPPETKFRRTVCSYWSRRTVPHTSVPELPDALPVSIGSSHAILHGNLKAKRVLDSQVVTVPSNGAQNHCVSKLEELGNALTLHHHYC